MLSILFHIQLSLYFISRISFFYIKNFTVILKSLRWFCLCCLFVINLCTYFILFFHLLLKCGDIETNPGPENSNNLSICHWNLNGIDAHNYAKVSSISSYLSLNSIDIMFLSETFLNSSSTNNISELSIDGYQLERADHPNDLKKGGVCVYYKKHLPLKIRNDICLLQECLVCEIKVDRKKYFLTGLYGSPS